jgi:hypothetical protein
MRTHPPKGCLKNEYWVGYQEIFAEFVVAVKESEAQWYSIKPLQNDIPSLADLLEVSAENLQTLFVKAGLGKLGQDNKTYSFQPAKFDSFRSAFMIQDACEATRRQVKGLKTKQWFVRLGSQYYGDLSDPGTKGRAPRVQNIRAKRRDFQDAVSKLPSLQQEAELPLEEDEEEVTNEGHNEQTGDRHENDLVLLRVQRMLLPLLMKEEFLYQDFWSPDVDSAAVGAALHSIVTELRQHRDDSLSAILATVQVPTSPATKESPSVVPTLKAYGVSLEDRRVHENLLRDLFFLNKKHDKSNTLYCKIRNDFTSSFVHVPSSKGFVRMKENARKTKWLPDVLTALGGPGKEHESLLDLLTYIGQNDDYKATWEAAVRMNGLVLPTLDGVATKAVQSMCNMNKSQMKQLRSCLKAELGSSIFSTEYKIQQVLGLEHVQPRTGAYKYGKEKIDWSYKPINQVLELWLNSRTKGSSNFQCDRLDIVVTIDHGKGHSRITCNLITRWQDETGEWNENEYACTIGNARCKKDNADIIIKTFGTLLNDDLKTLASCISIIEGEQAEFGANVAARKNIPINLFMAGDILFYNMVIGKEGMSGWWCSQCKLFKTTWQHAGHDRGEPWTIESLKEHARKIENNEINTKDVQAVCGVRGKPIFDAIPLSNFITPILHMTIGKGNNVLDNYVAEMQAAAEGYSDEYYAAEKDQVLTTAAHLHAKEELAQFNMVTLEYEKDLKRQQRRNTLSVEDRLIVELELSDIIDERTLLQDAVPRTKALQLQAKKRFAAELKKPENGKAFGQPINAKMDEVLKKNGIDRAAQFGGTIEGNGARTLMEKCHAIIDEVEEHVLRVPTRVAGTDDEIRHVGMMHKHLLTSLDGYFSALRTKRFHVTPAILEMAKLYRDRVLAIERYLGMSVTTKSHLAEDHSVEQQEDLDGIGDLGEDFGERNHQDEAKADRRLGCVRNFATRESIKSKEEMQIKSEKVQAKIVEIKEKRKKGPSDANEARQAAKKQRRMDARAEVLAFPAPEGRMTTLRQQRSLELVEA